MSNKTSHIGMTEIALNLHIWTITTLFLDMLLE